MKIQELRLEVSGPPGSGKTVFLRRLKKLCQLKNGVKLNILSIRDTENENVVIIRHNTNSD